MTEKDHGTRRVKVDIRPMTGEDIQEVHSIEKASFSFPWEISTFYDILGEQDHYIHVARKHTDPFHGAILGYSIFIDIGHEYHLINLAVHPLYKRRSIASQLIDFIIDRAVKNNVGILSLEVRVSNDPAISFYTAHGFMPVAIRRHYYKDNDEDACVMWFKMPAGVHPETPDGHG